MKPLENIDIKVETSPVELETGNLSPILHQIRHALEKLLTHQEASAIDLNAMPFAPGEKDKLKETLGEGEIKSQLNVLGRSEIYETQYAGVWWIEHYNSHDNVMGQLIEITWLPELLKSQPEDVEDALSELIILCETQN